MTMSLPRCALGANSLTKVLATGSSPPRPKPTRKRMASSAPYEVVRPHRPVATLKMMSVVWKSSLRPKRSASRPTSTAPANIPTRPMLPMRPTWAGESAHSFASTASTKETSPESNASKSQPRPEAPTRFQWNRDRGKESSRSLIFIRLLDVQFLRVELLAQELDLLGRGQGHARQRDFGLERPAHVGADLVDGHAWVDGGEDHLSGLGVRLQDAHVGDALDRAAA